VPLFHCNKCHHEWEGTKDMNMCTWCGTESYILEEQTPLEKMINSRVYWKMIDEMTQEILSRG
jgi:hypothetical protein